jgi:hypothetical protein
MILNNTDNKKVFEQLLSSELWETVTMNVSYVKKEEYFAQKMWL